MKEDFLDYYRANLVHLRELSAEFAQQFPKVAAKLNISQLETQDPFVERLLEGSAFLAARVEKKFDDGYPLMLQSLLLRVCPLALSPLPAGAVVSFEKNPACNRGLSVGTDVKFEVVSQIDQHSVIFHPLWDVQLLPIICDNAEYRGSLIDSLDSDELEEHDYKTCLNIDLTINDLDVIKRVDDQIDIYLNLIDSDVSMLSQCFHNGLKAVYIKNDDKFVRLDNIEISTVLYSEKSNLFLKALKTMPGIAKMQLALGYPFLSHFIRIKNLLKSLADFGSRNVSVLFCFDMIKPLSKVIHKDSVRFNICPLLNLFTKRSDRSTIDVKREFLVDLDRTEPLNYEIFSIESLEVFDLKNQYKVTALPFYSFSNSITDEDQAVFFGQRRSERLNGIYKKRSTYHKTDVFVSLAGENYWSSSEDFSEFSANCWATNADLPMFIRPDATFKSAGDGQINGTALIPLVKPQSSLIVRGDFDGFKGLSFVLMNVSALLYQDGPTARNVIQQMVGYFMRGTQEEKRSLMRGLAGVDSKSSVFRFVKQGCVYYEQGFELLLTLDAKDLAGVGIFTFAQIVVHVLNEFCPINLMVRFKVVDKEQGIIYEWNQSESR